MNYSVTRNKKPHRTKPTHWLSIRHSSLAIVACLLGLFHQTARAEPVEDPQHHTAPPGSVSIDVPDLRDEKSRLGFFKEHFVIAPLPVVNPTFGNGLVVGGAYFYSQSEEQKKVQPASFTGIAAGYTDTGSWFVGAMQQNYWNEDKWRFTAIAGLANAELELPVAVLDADIDWILEGGLVEATIMRALSKDWYIAMRAEYMDVSQAFGLGFESTEFMLDEEIQSVGLGLGFERDTRDMPTNPYSGSRFDVSVSFSEAAGLTDETYESYSAKFSSYHKLKSPFVIAWQLKACARSGVVPLWAACSLGLRGFPMTEHMSNKNASAQVEARWQASKRWGAVAFAGGGYVKDAFNRDSEDEIVPSYGLGIRFMIMESKRINLRLDYARSDGDSAFYFSAGEAF